MFQANRLVFPAAVAALAGAAQAQSITNLGVLQDTHHFSQGAAVSGNGAVVLGHSGVQFFEQTRSFRWSTGGGLLDIGALPDAVNTFATAINADGTAVAGASYSADRDSAFRWTAGGGFQNLGTLPGAPYGAMGSGISGDGEVVIGTSSSPNGDRAIRWTSAGGMQDLGVLPGGDYSFGVAVSANSGTLTGISHSANGEYAFAWTSGGGMQPLIGNGEWGGGFAVNADGSVIAGYCGQFASRWVNGVYESLGSVPGGTFSAVYAISGDGSLIGGFSDNSDGDIVATIWSPSLGMVDLGSYLTSIGVDMSGWTLTTTTGISSDGRTLVGAGMFNGEERGWVATIPAPGAAGLFAAGGLFAARRRTRP